MANGNEYELILEKARKSVDISHTNRQHDERMDGTELLEELHSNIDTLQHINTFTVEHPEAEDSGKQGMKKMAKRLVSSALQPAMMQQTQYNETATASLYNLTLVTQKLVGQTRKNRDVFEHSIRKIADSLKALDENFCELKGRLKSSEGLGGRASYSRAGEDMIIYAVLKERGIAAADATYFETGAAGTGGNTYFFNVNGAHGVVLQPVPEKAAELEALRGGDVVIERCLSEEGYNIAKLYVLNTGQAAGSLKRARALCEMSSGLFIDYEVETEAVALNDIIEEYFEEPPVLLSLDVEGTSLLDIYDFKTFRPLVVAAGVVPDGAKKGDAGFMEAVRAHMAENGYVERAFTGYTLIFEDAAYGGEAV